MENWYTENVRTFFNAVLHLKTQEECVKFFEDICTIKEIQEIAQRLEVAKLLSKRTIYADIEKKTGASTATISRVNRCLSYGNGGYELIIGRLEEEVKTDE